MLRAEGGLNTSPRRVSTVDLPFSRSPRPTIHGMLVRISRARRCRAIPASVPCLVCLRRKKALGKAMVWGITRNRCTPGRKPSMAGWGLHGRAYASPRFASRVGVSRKSARSEQGVSAEGRRCRQAVVVVVVEELGSCHPWWDDAGEYARWRRPETGPSPLTVDLSDRPQRGY